MNIESRHIVWHFSGTLTHLKKLLIIALLGFLCLLGQGCKEKQTPVDNPTIIDNAPQFESTESAKELQTEEQSPDSVMQQKLKTKEE